MFIIMTLRRSLHWRSLLERKGWMSYSKKNIPMGYPGHTLTEGTKMNCLQYIMSELRFWTK